MLMPPTYSILISLCFAACAIAADAIRPPAVPLVTSDPYFSIWSMADHLTDDQTRHWTASPQPLDAYIRCDGKAYRLIGNALKSVDAMKQTSVAVLPTRSVFTFESSELHLTLTFMTPALPDDLDVLSRPLTYVICQMSSADARPHNVSLYFSAGPELAVDSPEQFVVAKSETIGDLVTAHLGTEDQPILERRGDSVRIDWGQAYVAAPTAYAHASIGPAHSPEFDFVRNGTLRNSPTAILLIDFGQVATNPVTRHWIVAYDDEFSINYFGKNLRPYWRRNGAQAADLLQSAEKDFDSLQKRCEDFDTELMADLTKVGGEKYAMLCALAYRQCLAGCKLAADANGQPMLFPKENTSNGCISTVDVIYPMEPTFLLFSPTLAKASLAPVLNYAASSRWKWPFAPHDLGTYPQATGQVYGGGEASDENQMPVEESGNMIILLDAIAQIQGNADFAGKWWPEVTKWAEYLKANGFDPTKQLCTDDFAGHLAHNTNLSIKAIEALGAFANLADMRGDQQTADQYRKLATDFAAQWIKKADDGDHFRLAFDAPGTWSQKYNLVWDRILDLNLFPAEVAHKEIAFYLTKLNPYGLPLDNRQAYTKTDWTFWTATLAMNRKNFEALIDPVYRFANETPSRVPFSDFYYTTSGKDAGMHARPVIGGVFIKMLSDETSWKKWASRDKTTTGDWAPLPPPQKVKSILPTAQVRPATWQYTTDAPASDWFKPSFDASAWKQGPSGFGAGTPGGIVHTPWNTPDIWLRREVDLPDFDASHLKLLVRHDEDAEIYFNGVLAAKVNGYITNYESHTIQPDALATLKPGKNLIAVHCHQTIGGQFIDVGLVEVIEAHS